MTSTEHYNTWYVKITIHVDRTTHCPERVFTTHNRNSSYAKLKHATWQLKLQEIQHITKTSNSIPYTVKHSSCLNEMEDNRIHWVGDGVSITDSMASWPGGKKLYRGRSSRSPIWWRTNYTESVHKIPLDEELQLTLLPFDNNNIVSNTISMWELQSKYIEYL